VQDDIEQGAVNLQLPVVFDEAEFAEPVHEEGDPRSRSANDLRQSFLTHFRNHLLRFPLFAEVRQ
jgi:hypothetical protein